MKAISIRQPWAWLIVQGHKDIENRTWPSGPRGRIAIHASKTFDRDGYEWARVRYPEIVMPAPEQFDRGGVVGTVEHCGSVDGHDSPWFEGPHGHVLVCPRPCRFSPCRGQLGFFEVAFPERTRT